MHISICITKSLTSDKKAGEGLLFRLFLHTFVKVCQKLIIFKMLIITTK